jgi:hypothetical protein
MQNERDPPTEAALLLVLYDAVDFIFYAVNVTPTSFAGVGTDSVATSTTVRWTGNIVRVGLNYKFGRGRWGAEA